MTAFGPAQDSPEAAVQLSVALSRLRSRLREESGSRRTGLTVSQLAAMQRIIDAGPTTAAALAAAEHVSQQAVAQNVAALRAWGLVRSAPDPDDGRKVLLSATDQGRALFARLRETREAWLARAIDAVVMPEEWAALQAAISLLERLAGADLSPDVEIR
jgi:DNA-binding MarR family transcriptional regulator